MNSFLVLVAGGRVQQEGCDELVAQLCGAGLEQTGLGPRQKQKG